MPTLPDRGFEFRPKDARPDRVDDDAYQAFADFIDTLQAQHTYTVLLSAPWGHKTNISDLAIRWIETNREPGDWSTFLAASDWLADSSRVYDFDMRNLGDRERAHLHWIRSLRTRYAHVLLDQVGVAMAMTPHTDQKIAELISSRSQHGLLTIVTTPGLLTATTMPGTWSYIGQRGAFYTP